MCKIIIRILIFAITEISIFSTCAAQIKIMVKNKAAFATNSKSIYLAGTFNNWKQLDEKYRLTYDTSSQTWGLVLDEKTSAFEFQFSLGDTASAEVDSEGRKMGHRMYIAPIGNPDTTLIFTIEGWRNLQSHVNIRLIKLPENTPEDSKLFVTGNFTGYDSSPKAYQLIKYKGFYRVSIPCSLGDTIIYKFTRGTWGTVEGGYSGGFRPNRIHVKKINEPETIDVTILSWEDLSNNVLNLFSFTGLLLSALGLIVVIMLMSIDKESYTFTRPLLFLIFIYSSAFFIKVATDSTFIFDLQPRLYLYPELIWFSFAPIFYYFARLMTKRDIDKEVEFNLLTLIPFGFHCSLIMPILLLNDVEFKGAFVNQTYQVWFGSIGGFAIIFNIIWWIKNMNYLRKVSVFGKEAIPNYRINLLINLLWLYFMILIIWFLVYIVSVLDWVHNLALLPVTDIALKIIWILICFSSIIITYYALKYPELFKRKRTTPNPLNSSKPKEEIDLNLQRFQDKLEKLMEDEVSYSNPLLSIKDVANAVGTNTHTISSIINDKFQRNFNDFVNSYRVKAFIKKVSNSSYAKNFTEISYEVGFNSKATFNRAFKKATGLTPSEYFNQKSNRGSIS